MTLAYEAMAFAREAHAQHRRRYTGAPYADHLAEVAGIAMTVAWPVAQIPPAVIIATCWLHDCMEDQGISHGTLVDRFGCQVADGVRWLSDLEQGNRAARKAASRARLAQAPHWVQTIKVADLISNTSSIVEHDPKFALVYLDEKQQLLEVLTRSDIRLRQIAREQCVDALKRLGNRADVDGTPPPIIGLPVRDLHLMP